MPWSPFSQARAAAFGARFGYGACFLLAFLAALVAAILVPRLTASAAPGRAGRPETSPFPHRRRRGQAGDPMSNPASISPSGDFDLSGWPIARYRMPEHVPDGEADARVAEFNALIGRGERFVLVFHGPEMPKNSRAS